MQSTRTVIDGDDVDEIEQKMDEMSISESSRSGSSGEELSKLKNENYHLKLAIAEKNDEIVRMLDNLHKEAYLENIHKVLPSLQNSSLLYVPSSQSEQQQQQQRQQQQHRHQQQEDEEPSIIDSEVATHISTSPYKGNRTRSRRTESSLASTSAEKRRKRSKVWQDQLIPFLQRSIQIFHSSSIFQKETVELDELWQAFQEGNCEDEILLIHFLENLNYLQQQTTVLLNRELHFKKMSQQLEYLFTIFLDPKEYDMAPQEHIKKLKNDLLNILIKLFDRNPLSHENNGKLSSTDSREQKIANWERGINLCTDAMSNAYSSRKPTMLKLQEFQENIANLPLFSNQEKQRLRKSRNSLEFIPIGYDETMLSTRTPQKPLKLRKENLNVTPISQFRREENDSLQEFFLEQSDYNFKNK